jgi:hypothetical protein
MFWWCAGETRTPAYWFEFMLYFRVMVRPERLELPAYWFEASRSIQLSYGRIESTI